MAKNLFRRLERLEAEIQETVEDVRGTCVPGPLAAALRDWALLFASARGDTEPNSDDWGVAASFIHRCRRVDVAPTWVEFVRWTQTTEEGEGGHGSM